MKILTVKQAAEFLQVSDDSLYPLISRGIIPAAKIKGQWRLIDEDLVEWMRAQYGKPAAALAARRESVRQAIERAQPNMTEYARLLGRKAKKPPK